MDEQFEKHLAQVYQLGKERMAELGIEGQMPSLGVFRLLHDVIVNYWEGLEELNVEEVEGEGIEVKAADPKELRISSGDNDFGLEVDDEPAEALLAHHDTRQTVFFLGVIDRDEGAVYVRGHKVTVDFNGKIHAHHQDGSECFVPCRHCKKPDVYVHDDFDGGKVECFAVCHNCGRSTDLYADKYHAIGAWIVGKVEREPEL